MSAVSAGGLIGAPAVSYTAPAISYTAPAIAAPAIRYAAPVIVHAPTSYSSSTFVAHHAPAFYATPAVTSAPPVFAALPHLPFIPVFAYIDRPSSIFEGINKFTETEARNYYARRYGYGGYGFGYSSNLLH